MNARPDPELRFFDTVVASLRKQVAKRGELIVIKKTLRTNSMKYIFIPVLMMLSACSTIDDLYFVPNKTYSVSYKEPETVKATRLRVITDGNVRLFPGRSCYDWNEPKAGMVASTVFLSLIKIDKTYNDRKIGIPRKGELKESSEVYIKPQESLVVVYGGTSEPCLVAGSFVPEDNSDYQILANNKWGSGRCEISLSKITVDQTSGAILDSSVKLNSAGECKK